MMPSGAEVNAIFATVGDGEMGHDISYLFESMFQGLT
jgi:hypothetical protein